MSWDEDIVTPENTLIQFGKYRGESYELEPDWKEQLNKEIDLFYEIIRYA